MLDYRNDLYFYDYNFAIRIDGNGHSDGNIDYETKKQKDVQVKKSILVVDQNNYTTNTVNTYIVYDLDKLARNIFNNFTLKKCFFA